MRKCGFQATSSQHNWWIFDSTSETKMPKDSVVKFEEITVTIQECLNEAVSHIEKAWQLLVLIGAKPHGKRS